MAKDRKPTPRPVQPTKIGRSGSSPVKVKITDSKVSTDVKGGITKKIPPKK